MDVDSCAAGGGSGGSGGGDDAALALAPHVKLPF
jgi:hypothetical protein